MKVISDSATIQEVLDIAPDLCISSPPKHRDDFGPMETSKLHLRRRGADYTLPGSIERAKLNPNDCNLYGLYLWRFNNQFIVGAKHLFNWQVKHLEVYKTLDELKQDWELD